MDRVFGKACALAVALFGDRQELVAVIDRLDADDVAAAGELHAAYATARTAGGAQVIDFEANGLTGARHEQYVAFVARHAGGDEVVAVVEPHGNLAVAADLLELL